MQQQCPLLLKNQNKFIKNLIEPILCYYSDAFVLVTADITFAGGNVNTKVAFKNCTSFKTCRTEINIDFVDEPDYIYIGMHIYNLIEYSDNCSDTSGSL